MTEEAIPSTPKSSKKPTHIAYQVRDGKNDDDSYWDRIGVAWVSDKGYLSVQLHSVPLDGRVVLGPRKERQPR